MLMNVMEKMEEIIVVQTLFVPIFIPAFLVLVRSDILEMGLIVKVS